LHRLMCCKLLDAMYMYVRGGTQLFPEFESQALDSISVDDFRQCFQQLGATLGSLHPVTGGVLRKVKFRTLDNF
jgi:hypothetical protein